MDEAAKNLIDTGLLIDNSGPANDLETVLNLLSAPNLKILCKEMNFSVEGTKQKSDYINAVRKHLELRRKSVFSQSGNEKMKGSILKKANTLLGLCYKLESEPRKIFLRILSLYSLTDWWDERENSRGGPAPTLTTVLLKNTGRLVFPLYSIDRRTKIFPTRWHLIKFEEACTLEANFVETCEEMNWDSATKYGKEAEEMFLDTVNNTQLSEHAAVLPEFLKKFTPGSILAYVLTQFVDLYEKLKDYEQAVALLSKLIAQDSYLPTYRGHWYERLCLDLDLHLKKPQEALVEASRGLNDPNVRIARRHPLCQRIKQICYAKKNVKIRQHYGEEALEVINKMYPQEFDEVVLQGRLMPKAPNGTGRVQGGKSIFVFGEQGKDEKLLCSVEEFVRESYRKKGFTQGIHAEGSVVNTIFTILFWDVLYYDVPDVFRTPHQSVPLDFDTDDFYVNRKDLVDNRLEEIQQWSFHQLSLFVEQIWGSWANTVTSSPANWDLFPSGVEELLGLLKCFSGFQLRGICERLAKDHRHTRSGFPDLTLWNPNEMSREVAFIEVKGPNDKLSAKQILWLNYLNSLQIRAFVCHVEALNAKNLRSPKKMTQNPMRIKCDDSPNKGENSISSNKLGGKQKGRVDTKTDFDKKGDVKMTKVTRKRKKPVVTIAKEKGKNNSASERTLQHQSKIDTEYSDFDMINDFVS